MRYRLRVLGWLLLGMGIVLGGLGACVVAGLFQMPIEFFGIAVDTPGELRAWVAGWLVAALAGGALLRAGRRERGQKSSGR